MRHSCYSSMACMYVTWEVHVTVRWHIGYICCMRSSCYSLMAHTYVTRQIHATARWHQCGENGQSELSVSVWTHFDVTVIYSRQLARGSHSHLEWALAPQGGAEQILRSKHISAEIVLSYWHFGAPSSKIWKKRKKIVGNSATCQLKKNKTKNRPWCHFSGDGCRCKATNHLFLPHWMAHACDVKFIPQPDGICIYDMWGSCHSPMEHMWKIYLR